MKPSPSRLWIAFVVVATLAYYFWTGMVSFGELPPIHGQESDYFNLLSRGFKQGHLYLDHEVPAGLLQASNPYDPALRQTVSVLHDASYFRGKYYIYFGPAPVVTLLLPFSLVTGRDLPLAYGVWIFSSAGYVALAGIFLFLQRRYFPRASLWSVTAGLIALGGANMLVALLRRSNIWEFSAASGFCFFTASVYCLIRALHSPRARSWATLGGLALGLAVASRPTYILCSALFTLPVLLRTRGAGENNAYDWRALLGAAAGCGLPVLGLLAYNYVRFDHPLEFGLTYQLTSVIESQSRHFSLSYVPFNFQVYFLSTLRWVTHFPFVNGIVVPPFPPGHGGHEYTFGLFPNLPFSLIAIVPLLGLARGWRPGGLAPALWLSVSTIAGAALLNAAFLLCFFGSCIRYMVDFAPWFMLLAAIGVLFGEGWLRTTATRWLLRGAALALAVFSAFTAAATVVEFYYSIPGEPLAAYRPIARVLNFPVYWLSRQRWPDYSPQELTLSFPADRTPRHEPLLTVSRAGRPTSAVFVDYLDDRKVRLGYREGGRPPIFSPAVAAPPGGRHTLRLSIGGLYGEFSGARGQLRAQFDDVAIWDVPAVSFGTYPGDLTVGEDSTAPPAAARFTGEIHAVRSIALPAAARPKLAGIRVRLFLKPGMAGRAYPLLTSGRTKAGDLFFVHVHAGNTISFGYDHWGDALLTSPEIAVASGKPAVVEFWAPALAPPGADPFLLVKVNGATVWRRTAPAYPTTPETLFLGRNPIGGTTCELALEDAVFEDLELTPPTQN